MTNKQFSRDTKATAGASPQGNCKVAFENDYKMKKLAKRLKEETVLNKKHH